MRSPTQTLPLALALSLVAAAACGKGDAKADGGDAKAASGEAKADGGEVAAPAEGAAAPAPKVELPPADPKLVAAIKAELDKVGDCKMGGEAAPLDDDPATSVTLKGYDHDNPQDCEDKAKGWEELADKNYGDEESPKFKAALLANINHAKPVARYYAISSLADFAENGDLAATDLAVLAAQAKVETDPAVSSLLGDELSMAKVEDDATAAAYTDLLSSTKNHALISMMADSWHCDHKSCVASIKAWAANPEPAIRVAGFRAASDMDEELMSDTDLCKLTATGLGDKDGMVVATSARLLFDIGEACKPQHGDIFKALEASSGEGKAALFYELWNNDPGDLTDDQNKALVTAAKAVKAAKPANEDHASAAEDCISAAG